MLETFAIPRFVPSTAEAALTTSKKLPHAVAGSCPAVVIAQLLFALGLVFAFDGCTASEPPPTRELIHVHGDSYERGKSHGTQLRSKVRSFYTTMLSASLLPYVNREKPDIAGALTLYAGPDYEGNFSYRLLLESAEAMKPHISPDILEEMRGIADGAGLTFEDVLLLNTFVDTVMAVRGVALALRLSQSPELQTVQFKSPGGGAATSPMDTDKIDNDGDGETDEAGEATVVYEPSPHAALVEVPTDTVIEWVLADPDGVNTASIRAQLNDTVFTADDPAFSVEEIAADKEQPLRLRVTLTPPSPLPAGEVISLVIMAGDKSLVTEPPPSKARYMRDERIAFTTVGANKSPGEVANTGVDDGRSQPPASGFALRGTATTDGAPLLAQHFSLLDANTSHKHTLVTVHHPKGGKPFVTVGWAGVVWGFSGMNSRGLAGAVNYSDTLRNSVLNGLIPKISDLHSAKLITEGVPIGLTLRKLLEDHGDAPAAAATLGNVKHTFGWNMLLADAKGELRSAELDSMAGGRAFVWGPGDDPKGLGADGKRLSSVGKDDMRMGVHYVKNTSDMFTLKAEANGVPIKIGRQSGWSSYYFRSLRTFGELGNLIEANYGALDATKAKELLAHKALVDTSDGMNAVVLEPKTLRVHTAMGSVPATNSPFEMVEVPSE